jgi:AraC family transcriptional regulator, melibiose operon regulatory protein
MKQSPSLIEGPLLGFWSQQGSPEVMQLPHRHNELELNYLERGSVTYLFPGRRVEVPAERLFFFWSGVPHQMTAKASDTLIHWMTLPLAEVLRWRLPAAFTHLILQGIPIISQDGSFQTSDLAAFRRWHADLLSDDEDRRVTMLLEVQARLRRLAGDAPKDDRRTGKAPAGELSGKAEKMARYLSEHYLEDWRVDDVAQSAGLHPNYAMTAFRRAFGLSMVEYATQLKVARAQQLLATSDMEIIDIAFECGFGSSSRFYAAFREITKTTPRQFRASVQWNGKTESAVE